MKKAALYVIAISLSGCGHAWVIQQNNYGGVIGYKGHRSGDAAKEDIEKLIPCKPYRTENDQLMSSSRQTVMPLQSTNNYSGNVYSNNGRSAGFNGQETQTQWVPVQQTDYWRELTYRCESPSSNDYAGIFNGKAKPQTQKSSYDECINQCVELEKNGSLKKGLTAANCIVASCK